MNGYDNYNLCPISMLTHLFTIQLDERADVPILRMCGSLLGGPNYSRG